jgi:hypothetical protein
MQRRDFAGQRAVAARGRSRIAVVDRPAAVLAGLREMGFAAVVDGQAQAHFSIIRCLRGFVWPTPIMMNGTS